MVGIQQPKKSLQLSSLQKLSAYIRILFIFPFTLLWHLAASPFSDYHRRKPWRRRIVEIGLQALTALELTTAQTKLFQQGTTHETYVAWAKNRHAPIQVDELAHGGKIVWIGDRRREKVLLYMHGGGYIYPAQSPAYDFWGAMAERLVKSGKSVNVAALAYSLGDVGSFPLQLNQAVSAIQYLMDLGYQPEDIVLVGESSGGNLILQILLHILNPSPIADPLELPKKSKLAGALAVSAWVSFTSTKAASYAENRHVDIITAFGYSGLSEVYLEGVPLSAYPYIDAASSTPATWFEGLDGVVDKVLITAGERETSRDDIIKVGKQITQYHPRAKIIVQEDGLHADMFLDVPLNQQPPVKLTDDIFQWLKEVVD
ncbi:Alpha/Beta hydrolase protein [Ephemerocybe angulata]|uniref:Alpha/Beta hydrolase protein n=1 Tax=Ephemerocybe angulata TaxID=980116 RepID=A0A8H6M3R3_9AGAR|nr:Alpha/Beta hydrolase protein [Tulosesus angulatus]